MSGGDSAGADDPDEKSAGGRGGALPGEPADVEDLSAFAGEPDGFDRLWTPHRMAYIGGENKPKHGGAGSACPFCSAPERADEDSLIVRRGETAFVLLNLYPYNSGHVLVCPYRHVADYTELQPAEVAEVADLTREAMTVLRFVSGPAGFNIGMNQGEAGGAGIAAHLHQHIVPRWIGDANFLPIIGRTKALPVLLDDTRSALSENWDAALAEAPRPGGTH